MLSINNSGIRAISSFMPCFPARLKSSVSLFSRCSNTLDSCVPKKLEMIAGGASFAPRRWALVALEMLAFSNALWVYTAFSTLTTKVTKRRLSSGVLPGPIKRIPVSVPRDQLLCLPEPFTPLNGFSCNRTRNPCLREILRIRAMISKLWSLARLHSSKMGASSNWFGATSLWRVFTGMPSLKASTSRSFMNSMTRVGMAPK